MQFLLFRVSLVPSGNPGLFSSTSDYPNTDEKRFRWIVEAMRSTARAVRRKTDYMFMNVEAPLPEIAVGRLAHPDQVERSLPGPDGRTLVDQLDPTNAWTRFVFFGIGEQIIAVQRKSSFFSGSDDGLREIIEAVLNVSAAEISMTVMLEPLTEPATFWEIVRRSQQRFELAFLIDRPNVFSNRPELERIARMRHDQYNATESVDAIRNPAGELVIEDTPQLREQVEHVARGGGKWQLDATDADGERRTYTSTNSVVPKSVTMDTDYEEAESRVSWLERIVARIREMLPRK